MKSLDPYLMFDGNCREAMTFYADALKAELEMMDASQGPCAPEDAGRILHARLGKGSWRLMASDTMSTSGMRSKPVVGDNFQLSLDCDSAEEQDAVFEKLAEGGTVRMELQDTFWGARFGMLTDRFGVEWMLNFDKTPHEM